MNDAAVFEVECPACGERRDVRGVPNEKYVLIDDTRYRDCYSCSRASTGIGILRDRDYLQHIYASHSTLEIARELRCAPATVRRWLERHGIPRRTRAEARMRYVATARGDRGWTGTNRQTVTGRGNSGPGAVRHYDAGAGDKLG